MQIDLSNKAFWDVDIRTLNDDTHTDFIIVRVFEFGLMDDIRKVIKHYNITTISSALKKARSLNKQTINLAKVLGYL